VLFGGGKRGDEDMPCKSKATGEDKEKYATEAQAQFVCAEFSEKLRRKGDTDWKRLNVYHCNPCDGWHVGRKSIVPQPPRPVPFSKVVSVEVINSPSVVFHGVATDMTIGQAFAPTALQAAPSSGESTKATVLESRLLKTLRMTLKRSRAGGNQVIALMFN
jgi:hypothetical protein